MKKKRDNDEPKPKWDLEEWCEEKVFFKDHPVMDIVSESDKDNRDKRVKRKIRRL